MKTQLSNVQLTGGIDAKTSEPWSNKPNSIINARYTKTGSLTKRLGLRRAVPYVNSLYQGRGPRDFQLINGEFDIVSHEKILVVNTVGEIFINEPLTANYGFNTNLSICGDADHSNIIENDVFLNAQPPGDFIVDNVSKILNLSSDICLINESLTPSLQNVSVEVHVSNQVLGHQFMFLFNRVNENGQGELIGKATHAIINGDPGTTPSHGGRGVSALRVEYVGQDRLVVVVRENGQFDSFQLILYNFLINVNADGQPYDVQVIDSKIIEQSFLGSTVATVGYNTSFDICTVYDSGGILYPVHIIYTKAAAGFLGFPQTVVARAYDTAAGTLSAAGSVLTVPGGLQITGVSNFSRGGDAGFSKVLWSAVAQGNLDKDVYYLGYFYIANAITAATMAQANVLSKINQFRGATQGIFVTGTVIASQAEDDTIRVYNTQGGMLVSVGQDSIGTQQLYWIMGVNALGRPYKTPPSSGISSEQWVLPATYMYGPNYGTGCFIAINEIANAVGANCTAYLLGTFAVDSVPLLQYENLANFLPNAPTPLKRALNNWRPIPSPARGSVIYFVPEFPVIQTVQYCYGFMTASGKYLATESRSVFRCVTKFNTPRFSSRGTISENAVNSFTSVETAESGELGFLTPAAILFAYFLNPPNPTVQKPLPVGVYQYSAVFVTVDAEGREQRSIPSLPVVANHTNAALTPVINFSSYPVSMRQPYVTGGFDNYIGHELASRNYIEIYRTKVNEATFYLVGRFQAVQQTDFTVDAYFDGQQYLDIIPDVNLDTSSTINTGRFWQTPPNFERSFVANNKLFGVTTQGAVWISESLSHIEVPRFDISRAFYWDGEYSIEAISYMDGKYIFFTSRTVHYAVEDNTGSIVGIQSIPTDAGCDNRFSVVESPIGVFFQNTKVQNIFLLTRSMEVVRIGDSLPFDRKAIKINSSVLNAKVGEIYFFITVGTPANTPGDEGATVPETFEAAIIFDYIHGSPKDPCWVLDKYFTESNGIYPTTKMTRAYAQSNGVMHILGDATYSQLEKEHAFFSYGPSYNIYWDSIFDVNTQAFTRKYWIPMEFNSTYTRGPNTPSDNLQTLSTSFVLTRGDEDPGYPRDFPLSVSIGFKGDYPFTTIVPNSHERTWDQFELTNLGRDELLVTATPEISQESAVQVYYKDAGLTNTTSPFAIDGKGFEIISVVLRWGINQDSDVIGLEAGARK